MIQQSPQITFSQTNPQVTFSQVRAALSLSQPQGSALFTPQNQTLAFAQPKIELDFKRAPTPVQFTLGYGTLTSTEDLTLTGIAGEALGGQRLVRVGVDSKLYYADSSNTTFIGETVGMTLTSALIGASVQVKSLGLITEPSWTWTPGPIYLSTNGLPTQAPPTQGFVVQVAKALEPRAIYMNIQSATRLA